MERTGNISVCVSYSAKKGALAQEKLQGNPYQVVEIVSAREKNKGMCLFKFKCLALKFFNKYCVDLFLN